MTVIRYLAITNETVPIILSRMKDVNKDIRKSVLKKLANINYSRILSHKQFTEVLEQGLRDREESVRKSCILMIEKWAKKTSIFKVRK